MQERELHKQANEEARERRDGKKKSRRDVRWAAKDTIVMRILSADWIKCVGKIRGPVLKKSSWKNVSVPDQAT